MPLAQQNNLEDRILAAFNEFLESQLWKDSMQQFREKGFKMEGNKKTIKIMGLMGKFLKPEMIDRMILEIKDLAYQYAKQNPEKVSKIIKSLAQKLNTLLEPNSN